MLWWKYGLLRSPNEGNGSPDATTPPPAGTETPTDEYAGLPAGVVEKIKALEKYNLDLRKENETRRKTEQAAEAARMQREQDQMAEQGKFKELAEQRGAELERVKGDVERANKLEAIIRTSNDARLKRVPEQFRKLAPMNYTPEELASWLDENEAVLIKPTAPNLDPGKKGEQGKMPADPKATLKRQTY